MGDFVDAFVTAITSIPLEDTRDPPGDHRGTGWITEIGGHPLLCTCEHVARFQRKCVLGYSCFGGENGISVGRQFTCNPLPLDFAVASLERSWGVITHQGKCISQSMISRSHAPAESEYLYFYGFPGSDAITAYGEHRIRGTGVFLHEVDFNPAVLAEEPLANPKMHITMSLSPAHAVPLTPATGDLPLPDGMSGSALWNTRYREVTDSGRDWTPEDARVTGIVWGASQKSGVVLATRIEHFRHLISKPV